MSHCPEIGERELIRRISEILGGVENDDCAVIDAGSRFLVATTDMLHRQTDFPGDHDAMADGLDERCCQLK
jgi:thiamine monophosphate kinase